MNKKADRGSERSSANRKAAKYESPGASKIRKAHDAYKAKGKEGRSQAFSKTKRGK